MKDRPASGTKLLLGVFFCSLISAFSGQALVRANQEGLDPTLSSQSLWTKYRWSFDPIQRREAALILAQKSKNSPLRRKRLLLSQGWGNSSIAAVAIKLQARTAEKLGEIASSKKHWESLLRRFPSAVVTSDAYYVLGRARPELRQHLLKIYPSHPAALASAVELKNSGISLNQAAVHLARWGPRWHGAESLIRSACKSISTNAHASKDLDILAFGLSRLGDGGGAINCLKSKPVSAQIALAIGKALMEGDYRQQMQGKDFLLKLIEKDRYSQEALEALSLISRASLYGAEERLALLPKSLLNSSSGYIAAKTLSFKDNKADKILVRWANNPDIWQLQWKLARGALLAGQWNRSLELLNSIPTSKLPEPFAARKLFWKGFLFSKQGKPLEAKQIWVKLVKSHPDGYYTWRALTRLGLDSLPPLEGDFIFMSPPDLLEWTPLGSSEELVNQLWRLGLNEEAWETWRTLKYNPFLEKYIDLDTNLVEGRLKMAVGDDWNGLLTLWEISLMMVDKDCPTLKMLHSAQHPYRYSSEIEVASKRSRIRPELFLAIIKEESRFSPKVKSSSGAIGLMQLMPSTAMELSEIPLSKESLLDPETNISLAGLYLAKLFVRWQGNPWLTISSYNAGPMNVQLWLSDEIYFDPELWVERIPYPETRFYTKKVLGSLWSYLRPKSKLCAIKDS